MWNKISFNAVRHAAAWLLCALAAAPLAAQERVGQVTVTPHAGVNFSKVSGVMVYHGTAEDESIAPEMKAGITLGADAHWQFSRLWGVSAGVDYSNEGSGYTGFNVVGSNGKDVYPGGKLKTECLSVPLLATLRLGRTGLRLKAGVQAAWVLSAKYTYSVESYRYNDAGNLVHDVPGSYSETYNVGKISRKFSVGIPVGIEFEYRGVVADLRYVHGLTNINKSVGDALYSRSISLTVGYRIGRF